MLHNCVVLVGVGCVTGTAIGTTAHTAQPGADAPASQAAPPAIQIRPENLAPAVPTSADALRIHAGMREHLLAGAPGDVVPQGGDAWVRVSGVCLTVRNATDVVARVTGMEPRAAALAPDATTRAAVAARAVRDALLAIRTSYGLTAETPEVRRVLLGSLLLSVEIAGEPTPLLIDEIEQANLEVAPGLEGVGAIMPNGEGVWMFPSQQLALGLSPGDALASCVSKATGDPALGVVPARTLRTDRGITLVKFPIVHAAQLAPDAVPTLLYRGHQIVDTSQITYRELVLSAERVATHLASRFNAAERADLGTYAPVTGASTPASDPELAMQLTFAALIEYTRIGHPEWRGNLVRQWLDSVESVQGASLVARAAAVVAGERVLALNEDPAIEAEIRAKLTPVAVEVTKAFDETKGFSSVIPPAARGLVACALVRAARAAREPQRAEVLNLARAGVQRAFTDTPPGELVSQMPWLGWAAQELADLDGAKEIASAPALRSMRDRVWEHQLTPADAGAEGLDLVGGIVFTRGPAMLPTAATGRPIAFLAGALADARLTTDQERPGQIVRLIGALRFLRQLQADESTLWMYRERIRAAGGVRAAPWDHKMTADASVYTLLAYTRAITALDAQVKAPGAETPTK